MQSNLVDLLASRRQLASTDNSSSEISALHFLVSCAVGLLVGCLLTVLVFYILQRCRPSRKSTSHKDGLQNLAKVIPAPDEPDETPEHDRQQCASEQGRQAEASAKASASSELAEAKATKLREAMALGDVKQMQRALAEARQEPPCSLALIEQAEKVLQEINARAEIESALEQAIQDKDMSNLSKHLHAGKTAGISLAKIDYAERFLRELQAAQTKVEQILSRLAAAVEAPMPATIGNHGMDSLQQLVREAREHGVSESNLQEALKKIGQMRERHEHELAMRRAIAEGDLDKLERCLGNCLEVTCNSDIVSEAEALLAALKRVREIEFDLRRAIIDEDARAISENLQHAKTAKVSLLLIQEAERVLAVLQDAEQTIKASMCERNIGKLRKVLHLVRATNRFKDLLQEAKELENTFSRESLELDLRAAMDGRNYGQMSALLRRADSLGEQDRAICGEAEDVLSKRCHRAEIDVCWLPGSQAEPLGRSGWIFNPTVEICIAKDTRDASEVFVSLEDLDALQKDAGYDSKYGFSVIANPKSVSLACPSLVPGGPELAEAPYVEDGIASASFRLSTGVLPFLGEGPPVVNKAFAIPSLLGPALRGGRARLHFLSEVALSLRLLPDPNERWEFQESVQAEWLCSDQTAAGPVGRDGSDEWLSNPQFQVSLEEPGPLMVTLVLTLPKSCPHHAALHVLKKTMPTHPGARTAVVPNHYKILTQASAYSANTSQDVTAYLEIGEQDLVLDGKMEPFYLVPSLGQPGQESVFELRVFSSGKLKVERI
eukprot:gb/GFBE01053473.1/.p1 GENE.gb/GFBE01053473.1/~~gb/GFBE01053473.1/.p1  ORF type:complete len:778 (+),score=136.51 gb/GFBE01053473.1/:1-2334(+)